MRSSDLPTPLQPAARAFSYLTIIPLSAGSGGGVLNFICRSVFMSNAHPPGFYRATAALKHVDAFYEAFDIREGDKEWLPPERRVRAW